MPRFIFWTPVVSLALLGAACGTSTPTTNGVDIMSPTNAEVAVTTAIRNAVAVHMVIKVTQSGSTTTQILDAATTGGRRVIDVAGSTATILVTHQAGYLRAPGQILQADFGLSSSVAATDAGKWLSFPAGTSGYQALANGVTVGTLAQEVALSSVSRKTHSPINGVNVTALIGKSLGGSLELYVPLSGQPLPIAGIVTIQGASVNLFFSNWGEKVDLTPPSGSIPFPTPPPAAANPASSPSSG